MTQSTATKLYATNFQAFIEKAYRSSQGHKLDSTQKYINYIVFYLQALMRGDNKKLLVNLPGRHLKTFICSVCLPAFMLGADPTLKFLIVAYDQSLAEDIVRQIREIMQTDWYKAIFKTRLDPRHSKKDDFKIASGGRVRAAAIGNITGKGADIIIFDDPHNVNDWDNDKKIAKVIQAFEYLVSRRDGGKMSRILVVGHRIAQNDLSGHILARGDEFRHICLPLYAPKNMTFEIGAETWELSKGEALRPDAFPADEIKSMRRNHQGTPFWLYYQQGFGSKKDNNLIEVSHFPFLKSGGRTERVLTGAHVVLSVDPAQKTESVSRNVIHVYSVLGTQYTMLAAFAEKCSSKRLERKVRFYANKYAASLILVENTARGPDLIENLDDQRTPVKAINPKGSKTDRLRKCMPIILAKRVRIKKGRDDVEAAIDEIAAYPNAPYTDHVDALTNFLIAASEFRPDTFSLSAPRSASPIAVGLYSAKAIAPAPTKNFAVARTVGFNGARTLPDFSSPQSKAQASFDGRSPYTTDNAAGTAISFDGEKIVLIK